jgi:hypothetical protein
MKRLNGAVSGVAAAWGWQKQNTPPEQKPFRCGGASGFKPSLGLAQLRQFPGKPVFGVGGLILAANPIGGFGGRTGSGSILNDRLSALQPLFGRGQLAAQVFSGIPGGIPHAAALKLTIRLFDNGNELTRFFKPRNRTRLRNGHTDKARHGSEKNSFEIAESVTHITVARVETQVIRYKYFNFLN